MNEPCSKGFNDSINVYKEMEPQSFAVNPENISRFAEGDQTL